MAFSLGYLPDPQRVGTGERFDPASALFLTTTEFEDQLQIGRFAKVDTNRLDNMDGSATPVLAGVVLRKPSQPIEQNPVIDKSLFSMVEFQRRGLVTVEAKDGETPPDFLGDVYVSNAGDADDGKLTSTDTDVAVSASFVKVIRTNVWLIDLKL